MELALAQAPREVRTLRLAQPAVHPSSRFELTATALLAIASAGVWLLVLPLELAQLALAA